MNEPRKPLRNWEFGKLVLDQGGLCGCGCGEKLIFGPRLIRDEHLVQLAIGGSNDLSNRSLWRIECTKPKDVKDAKVRAKIRRLTGANKEKKSRPIQSRGFDKSLKKKFNGQIVRVDQ